MTDQDYSPRTGTASPCEVHQAPHRKFLHYYQLCLLSIRSTKDSWILYPDTADVYLYVTECFMQKSIICDYVTILGFYPDSTRSILFAIRILQNFLFYIFSISLNQLSKFLKDSESVTSNITTAPWHLR